jgi:predicted transcriptional regulator
MPKLNLTSRKNKESSPQPLSFFKKERNERTEKLEYLPKFSQAYQPLGHPYNPSFKVLRKCYWLEYGILDQDDIATYETLQFLAEQEIPFTIEVLAKRMKCGNATLQLRFDNLINAELLEIAKSDGQGSPNFYIIRTPYFERETIIGDSTAVINRQATIEDTYGKLPETFIDDKWKTLRRNVRKNKIKQLRSLYRQTQIDRRQKPFITAIKAEFEAKKLTWFKIVRKLGTIEAVMFDNIVWQLAKNLQTVESQDYWQIFKAALKKKLQETQIKFDEFLFDYARDLAVFYDDRRAAAPRRRATPQPSMPADNGTNDDARSQTNFAEASTGAYGDEVYKQNEKELLQSILKSRVDGSNSFIPAEIKEFARVFRDNAPHLTVREKEAIAKEFFDNEAWQKIKMELRE